MNEPDGPEERQALADERSAEYDAYLDMLEDEADTDYGEYDDE